MPHWGEARVLANSNAGLYVDGVEKYLLDSSDIAAPTLMVVVVPLLLYAGVILMPESTAGLQSS